MSIQTAFERLDATSWGIQSHVCVGLDPDPARMAIPDVFEFNKSIVDATRHAACAYKLQLAFYEALGVPGLQAMERTIRHVRDAAPRAVIIADCKRGDIGTVAAAYAKAMFETWGFDMATVMPYMGADSIEPWLQYPDRGVYIVCRTSNPGAHDVQELRVQGGEKPRRVFEWVAAAAARWGAAGKVGLVAGATQPGDVRVLREAHADMPFLVPGVGAQGGDVALASRAAANLDGRGFIINSSRAIIYASKDRANFARAARDACEKLRKEINSALTVSV